MLARQTADSGLPDFLWAVFQLTGGVFWDWVIRELENGSLVYEIHQQFYR